MSEVNSAVIELQAASEDLTANDTSDAMPCGGFKEAVIRLNCTITTDADDEVDFYLQTTYDGSNWCDILNIHFGNSIAGTEYKKLCIVGAPVTPAEDTTASKAPIDETDGTLTDDAESKLPLGTAVRWKAVITGDPTYSYNSKGHFRR